MKQRETLLVPGMGFHWGVPIFSEGGDGCHTWGHYHVWDNGEEAKPKSSKLIILRYKFFIVNVEDILLRSIYSEA